MAKSCRRCDMGNITLDTMTKKDRECVHSLIRFKERYRAYKNEQIRNMCVRQAFTEIL